MGDRHLRFTVEQFINGVDRLLGFTDELYLLVGTDFSALH